VINWFYVWGFVVIFVILGIAAYTYKEVSSAKREKNTSRKVYRDGVFAAFRAKDDGTLYTLIKSIDGDQSRSQPENASDEVAAATRTLMIWTAVLASATILMAYFAYFTLDAIRGQLTEMQTASADMKSSIEATNRLADAMVRSNVEAHRLADQAKRSADNAIETSERELRAYVGIVGDVILKCPLCDTTDINNPIEITREHMADNVIEIDIQNGGRTPAYNIRLEDSFWSVSFGQRLPESFDYPIGSVVALPFPFPNTTTTTLNPQAMIPADLAFDKSVITLIVGARRHTVSLFFYGNVNYRDVFKKNRTTPFCFEYFPDYPVPNRFVNCPEHNSPEESK
jgi:hypothetical protein